MKTFFSLVVIMLLLSSCADQSHSMQQFAALEDTTRPAHTKDIVGGKCEGCEIMYVGMPDDIPSVDTSVAWNEKGQKLLVRGIVYKLDGTTPAPNIILYYWHTDNNGYYSPSPNQDEKSKRHGHIRGWMKTDNAGRYAIYTIRPGSYPNEGIPAHIHILVKEPGINEYWIDEFLFDDDPLLTSAKRKKLENRGGNGILVIENKKGLQTAERNIILGLHVPSYPTKDNAKNEPGTSIGEYRPTIDLRFVSVRDKGKSNCPAYGDDSGQNEIMFYRGDRMFMQHNFFLQSL